ncbi:DUF2795 domain-containing protein [Streptomyces sp. CA-181903]|uniref:DUF2795 domain-containing protein n=1 Tax=Streptomyces sp. CA-181903 TaxID=3240055 RepID=UPI003D89B4F0
MTAKPNPIELQKSLGGMHYPADKETLVEHAKKKGADKSTLDALSSMPTKEYDSPAAVTEAVTKKK